MKLPGLLGSGRSVWKVTESLDRSGRPTTAQSRSIDGSGIQRSPYFRLAVNFFFASKIVRFGYDWKKE
jgi:hypothetical protein